MVHFQRIKIESFGFLPTEKSKEIEELKKEISELKSMQKQAEEGILNKKLEDNLKNNRLYVSEFLTDIFDYMKNSNFKL